MARYGTALAALLILLMVGAGVAMATGNGGFVKHIASSARRNADLSDDYEDDEDDRADEGALKDAYRRLKIRKAWDRYHNKRYSWGHGSRDDEEDDGKYCFGLKCKKKEKRDRDDDEESDEE